VQASELFGFNSAKLGPSQPKLDEVASTINSNPQIQTVMITGYTDRIGSPQYNQKLSERRAESVKTYLTGKGVPADKLQTQGKGEENPLVTCDNVKKRSELIKCLEPNRRVEIDVKYEK
jgi:OOP family OmpA-OmpF porin